VTRDDAGDTGDAQRLSTTLNRSPHPLTLLTPEGGNNRAQGGKNKGIAEACSGSGGLALHSYMACQHRAVIHCNRAVAVSRRLVSGDLEPADVKAAFRVLSRVLYWTS
jgi:hypothetical protein